MGKRFGQEYGLSLTKEGIRRLAILMAYEKDYTPFEKGVSRKTLAKRVNSEPAVKEFLSTLDSIGLWSGGDIPRQEIRRDLERLVKKGAFVKDKSRLGFTTFRRSDRPAPLPDYVLRVDILARPKPTSWKVVSDTAYGGPNTTNSDYKIETYSGFRIVYLVEVDIEYSCPDTTYASWSSPYYKRAPIDNWPTITFFVATDDEDYVERLLAIWDAEPLYSYRNIGWTKRQFTGEFSAPCAVRRTW